MVAYLSHNLATMKNLTEFKLNLRNRFNISSEALFCLKNALEKKFTLKKLTLYLEGTIVDPIICKKFEEQLKVFVD
jgi:hypothetical protein